LQQTLAEMADAQKKGIKRMRSETGIVSKKSSLPQVRRCSCALCFGLIVTDRWASVSDRAQGEMYEKWKKRTRREVGGTDEDGGRPMPNVRVNTKAKEELRTADQIRKGKESKENMKHKNMAKDKRGKMEASQRKKKKAGQEKYGNKKVNFSGMSRKSKVIVRV
jgi:hypothetical protein